MSRSANRTQNSVSLFPFLAVLVCAMGALIFLLLVTTRRIRDDARRAVASQRTPVHEESSVVEREPVLVVRPEWTRAPLPVVLPPEPEPEPAPTPAVVVRPPVPPPAPLPDPNVELRRTIAALEAELAERSQRVARATVATDTSAKTLAEVRAAAAATSAELDAERRRLAALLESAADLQAQRAAAAKDAESLGERLRRAKEKPVDDESRFALVPFDGSTGTTRRPIFIECTAEGLRFLPEGVLFDEADLVGFTYNFNPLLTGARSLVDLWSSVDRRDDPTSDSPYVLLLVRPDGAAAFYAAQQLLARLGTPTGYEIVPDDLPLAMPDADPAARAVLLDDRNRMLAERDRIAEQVRRLAAADRFPGSGTRGGGLGGDAGRNPYGGIGGSGPPGGELRGDPSRPNGDPGGISRRPVGIAATPAVGIGGAEPVGLAARPVGINGSSSDPRLGNENGRPIRPLVRDFPGGDRTRTDAGRPADAPSAPSNDRTTPSGDTSLRQLANNNGGGGAPPSLTAVPFTPDEPTRGSIEPYEGGLLDAEAPRTDDVFPKDDETSPFSGPRPDDVFNRATHGHPSASGGHAAVSRSGIGFEKPVLVEIQGDRMVIGERYTLPFERGQRSEDLVTAVLQGVDRVVAGWGRPPRGFHWVPRVRFRVRPGGNVTYERLRGRMEKTGLRTSVEYSLEATRDAAKP